MGGWILRKREKRQRQGEKKISLNEQKLAIFVVVCNKAIILIPLVGYWMIIANGVVGYLIHPVSKVLSYNNC